MVEQWERDSDVSLDAFDWQLPVHTSTSRSTSALPSLALAEYVDDDLEHVAPCTWDGTVYRVTDRVATSRVLLTAPPLRHRRLSSDNVRTVQT